MGKHSCKTYFSVNFEFDSVKNAVFLKERRDCLPEDIGIFNKNEVEKFIVDNFGITPKWNRHRFIIGTNKNYDVDVNKMLAITLKDLFGKEDKIKKMQERFSVTCFLEIVPYIASQSEEPSQILSLNKQIIDFLYSSNTSMDLDYYVV